MQLNRKSLLSVEDKEQLSELIAQRIKETQTQGKLYKLADKIIKFYTGTFQRTQDSYRKTNIIIFVFLLILSILSI